MRFIAVFHKFFVGSEGFEVMEINAPTYTEAHCQAAARNDAMNRTFQKCAFHMVEVGPDERLNPRRLTWRERWSGWIRPRVFPVPDSWRQYREGGTVTAFADGRIRAGAPVVMRDGRVTEFVSPKTGRVPPRSASPSRSSARESRSDDGIGSGLLNPLNPVSPVSPIWSGDSGGSSASSDCGSSSSSSSCDSGGGGD